MTGGMRVQRDMGWTMSELTKLETTIEHTIFRRLPEGINREKDRCRGRPEDDFTGLPSFVRYQPPLLNLRLHIIQDRRLASYTNWGPQAIGEAGD